ncbi:AAA family ATPase [Mycobacterium florentinum]|uniref:AAA family ATPase n=1 Tax=Mycobacterium florentinum TaxID=292462 RepID=A0A1X1UEN1_MYCFL|nr:AAA family ATPase [Mycobacterium florentinum]MCV7411721.1 AAA family ATPase [Mycobacterium florentinum]ORV55256.1 AAA family ATPase [Mycobacterium florentinum]
MPIRWNVPQHASTLEQLESALGDGARRGAVVLGPDGVGKSTLARLAAEHFSNGNPSTFIRWVTGTPTERVVPFGAFSHIVDIADIGKPAALLRAARASLSRDRQGELLLIVDDAHDLDILSATLVYQLALSGTARMIVTARADAAPEAIAALWTDGLLERIDVDAPGEATSAGEVDTFIAELPTAARAVLDYLAVQEPLSLADLTVLAGDGAVSEAQDWGAAETRVRDEHADDPVVYTAHPLFSERARAALGADGARRRRTELVELQSRHPSEHLSDRLRLASLALDSDAPQPVAEVVDAAQQALRLGDLTLGERFARSALQRCDDSAALAARLPLANSLAFQGRGREAEELLAAVDSAALSEEELMAWTLLRAANQFFMLSEPERATAFLLTIRNRVADVGPRLTLDALSATFAMNAGNIEGAVEIAHRVLDSPAADDQAVAWAASAATLCSARQGRFADVEPLAQRALNAEHPGLLRFTVGLGETTTLLMAGRVETATELAQQFTDFAELQQPGRAIGEVLLAHMLIAAGRFAEAAALLGPATAALERTGYSWGPLSLMLLATALAQQGDIAGSAKALSRAESRHGTKSALFTPELGVARAWRLAAERDSHGAIAAARDAARMAERRGQSAVALRVWHEAVRLGDIRAVDPLARLCDEVDCVAGQLALAHAKARATNDGEALRAVAEELTAVGLHAAAANAAAQAQQCA